MNVYDFDKTICKKDSSMLFYRFCLKRHPRILLDLPVQIAAFVRYYVLRRGTKTQMKEQFYRYFRAVPDISAEVRAFWEQNGETLIQGWYLKQKEPDDVIISASPEFLLEPICRQLGVRLIASQVDPSTGRYQGINCHGAEKVRRLFEQFPDARIGCFYSDSYSDSPLAELAKESFLVKGDALAPWEKDGKDVS
ncbi:MAG: HAD-IB family phosphatase [Clostridiales bacterium]|nr:HAD-IB family phosphatase [Clostridiales bacterium]